MSTGELAALDTGVHFVTGMQSSVALLASCSGVDQVIDLLESTSLFSFLLEGLQDLDLRVILGLTKLGNNLFLELCTLHSSKQGFRAIIESSAQLLRLNELLAVGSCGSLQDLVIGGFQVAVKHVLSN